MSQLLFSSTYLDRAGLCTLKNRVVMAPMTRCRAPHNIVGPLVKTYYEQRTEAGLIITEGASPSKNGLGYARIPGIFTKEQVAGWKAVTSAVKAAGTKIYVQMMHTGRVSQLDNMPQGAKVLAPSAIPHAGSAFTETKGMQPYSTPVAMTQADIETTVAEYVHAAKCAMEAGFDGIELHGANGYLIDQFLNTASNQRSDAWGGSVENRARFALAVTKAVAQEIGADRVGIRLSPYGAFNGMVTDPDMDKLFAFLAVELEALKINYIHIVDHSSRGAPPVKQEMKDSLRSLFKGCYILSGGYTAERAENDLQMKRGDLVAFGQPFISNPRLVSKMQNHEPLLPPDPATYYSVGEKGYTDYL
jgi:N-ethylmaleimide reductase